jgi:hypothetical protein
MPGCVATRQYQVKCLALFDSELSGIEYGLNCSLLKG